jgi:pyridoxamine 5'-phosphate oxidase
LDFAANPHCAATFFWEPFSRSVRIEGAVHKLSAEESDAYWDSRPRAHQLGALSSMQSQQLIGGDAELISRYEELDHQYDGKKIPRPDFWGGYVIVPYRIEFWQGRASRLHERLEYTRSSNDTGDTWLTKRLCP